MKTTAAMMIALRGLNERSTDALMNREGSRGFSLGSRRNCHDSKTPSWACRIGQWAMGNGYQASVTGSVRGEEFGFRREGLEVWELRLVALDARVFELAEGGLEAFGCNC